ncbi:MAG TPA: hypothetical protein VFR50_13565, partial [Casimicrobiaceae bacterium]|nr:hypothetical protein [Casimicrobiaceae bacterium]
MQAHAPAALRERARGGEAGETAADHFYAAPCHWARIPEVKPFEALTLEERIAQFAPRQSKGISYREAGAGPALVLLHGVGSSSASWLFQFES